MKRAFVMLLAAILVWVGNAPSRAEDAGPVLDRAIKALGGEEALAKAGTATWKTKGVITVGGNESEFTSETTVQGLDRHRSEFAGNFNGNDFRALSILNGDKGWRQFGDQVIEMDGEAVANEKRMIYLQVVPATLVPLKEKGFKVETAGEEKVGDNPAIVLKVTGPDGKDFRLSFDKESGLPVKQVADVVGWMGETYTQEVTYADYKDFGGIKRATRIEVKRDGDPIVKSELTAFKILDSVPDDTFAEPK
jgi:hypothetical protein